MPSPWTPSDSAGIRERLPGGRAPNGGKFVLALYKLEPASLDIGFVGSSAVRQPLSKLYNRFGSHL